MSRQGLAGVARSHYARLMTAHLPIAGVVLAGGGARRMFPASPGGGDKSFALLAQEPMIAHVLACLRPQVSHLLINANGDPSRFSRFGHEVVPDHAPDQGPLAGLLAAMDWVARADAGFQALVSVSTDTPFLPHDLVARLHGHAKGGAAVASSGDRLHPVIGLWPLALREEVASALAGERRSVEKFATAIGAVAVPFALRTIAGRTVDPFFNANTPQDLAHAQAMLSALAHDEQR